MMTSEYKPAAPVRGSTDRSSPFFDADAHEVTVHLDGRRPDEWLIKEYDTEEGWVLARPKGGGDLRKVYGNVEAFRE